MCAQQGPFNNSNMVIVDLKNHGCDQIIVTTTWLQFNVISMVFRSVVCSLYATKILHVLEIGLYANSDEKIGNLQEDDLPI